VIAAAPDFAGRLTFICALSGETGKHDAMRSAIEHGKVSADMAVLYGNSLKITLGNRGRIDVFVTVKGAPCHSSRPQQGANAITGALEAIRLVTALKLQKTHADLGGQSLTVNRIKSYPESTHTVQERCEFTIDRRLLPGDDPDAAFEEIKRALAPLQSFRDPVSGKSFGLEVRLGPFMYPSLVGADSPVVEALQAASLAMLGRPAETYYASAAFDQGYLNHIGIPTANYGPGEERYAHTDNDMASVERTFDAARVYAYLLMNHLTRS
jgi:acetylornithine deacetylase